MNPLYSKQLIGVGYLLYVLALMLPALGKELGLHILQLGMLSAPWIVVLPNAALLVGALAVIGTLSVLIFPLRILLKKNFSGREQLHILLSLALATLGACLYVRNFAGQNVGGLIGNLPLNSDIKLGFLVYLLSMFLLSAGTLLHLPTEEKLNALVTQYGIIFAITGFIAWPMISKNTQESIRDYRRKMSTDVSVEKEVAAAAAKAPNNLPKVQEIVFVTISEILNVDGLFTINGTGFARMDDGHQEHFWGSSTPPAIAVELKGKNIESCVSAAKTLKSDKTLTVVGKGRYSYKPLTSSSALTTFQLDEIQMCQ